MSNYLFDTPWWLPAAIALIGIVVFVSGNRRVEKNVRLAGVGIVALAVLLVAVSWLVDTPLERAEKQSNELVRAFERADWAKFAEILHRDATITILGTPIYEDREDILAAAKVAHSKYGFKNLTVLSSTAEQAQTEITITIVLLSEQSSSMAQTINSQWQFAWQKRTDGWSLVEVRALKIGPSEGANMTSLFPAGKR